MKRVLEEIQNGTFARQWIQEKASGGAEYQRLMNQDMAHPIEKVGAELRGRMSWLNSSGAANDTRAQAETPRQEKRLAER
jgi:ketol-acid reductoisomerase